MTITRLILLPALCLVVLCAYDAAHAGAPKSIRRFALIVGANDGGKERVKLRYAESDARSFEKVLLQLGGVRPKDTVFLNDPIRSELKQAFKRLRALLEASRGQRRLELVFYYSGHSDERGLLLGGRHFTYLEVRQAIRSLPADVRLAVLDSCASGTLTREKGGRRRPPFLVDGSGQVRGHAFLTSASANETAQESDRIGASFFTHYLVSGLRGAADGNRDGRVTLNEAYHYAFHETLAQTESTRSGPQHANYDMQLVGSGDLVLTDLRGTSAMMVLTKEIKGRVFIRDRSGQLVAEINKTKPQAMKLALAPGGYQLALERRSHLRRGAVTLKRNATTRVRLAMLGDRDDRKKTTARGTGGGPAGAGGVGARADAVAGGEKRAEKPPSTADITPPPPPEYRRVVFSPPFASLYLVGDEPVRTHLSLSLLWSYYAELHGFDLTMGAAWADHRVRGIQLSMAFNYSGGDVRGGQITMGYNHAEGDLRGTQIAMGANHAGGLLRGLQVGMGYNYVGEEIRGSQVAMGFNLAGSDLLGGFQAGMGFNIVPRDMFGGQVAMGFNYTGGDMGGVQLAMGFNIARGLVDGVQAAMGFNIARDLVDGVQVAMGFNSAFEVQGLQVGMGLNQTVCMRGAQIGLINVGGDIHGAQIGLINFGGRVTSAQIGLVNIASESNVTLGLLNLVKDGVHYLEVWTSDTALVNGGFKLGGRHMYSVFGVGSHPTKKRWKLGLGFGGHVDIGPLFLETDIMTWHVNHDEVWTNRINLLNTWRIILGYQLHRHFGVFAGASYNVLVTQADDGAEVGLYRGWSVTDGETVVRMWPGFLAGVRF
jgi:hypothetical protein